MEAVYEDCSIAYGCFGAPARCEESRQCDVLFTYVSDGAELKMGLLAADKGGTYAAVGFSQDDSMVKKRREQYIHYTYIVSAQVNDQCDPRIVASKL